MLGWCGQVREDPSEEVTRSEKRLFQVEGKQRMQFSEAWRTWHIQGRARGVWCWSEGLVRQWHCRCKEVEESMRPAGSGNHARMEVSCWNSRG